MQIEDTLTCKMNKLTLIAIGITLALFAGCASPSRDHGTHPPAAGSNSSADVLIVSAVYGSGAKFADVTSRVDELLRQPKVEFFARPEWLNADPTPGWNKALVIVYDYRGERHTFSTGEGGGVSLDRLIRQAKRSPKKR